MSERRFETVGVVGAGVIGAGVAQALAQADHRVVLVDVSQDALDRAREAMAKALRFAALFNKAAAVDAGEVLGRITFTTASLPLAKADFIVENVTETWEAKAEVYPMLDAVCQRGAVFAANTSCIPIAQIASLTERAGEVIGIHFMNPVPLTPMAEVVQGEKTSQTTLDIALALLDAMGKEAIVVNDAPGFVSNRVLMLMINEAIHVVQDGVASAADVDRLFKGCFGHKMGPLETADLIGLDTILNSLAVLHDCFGAAKYEPCSLLKEMVASATLGRKTGGGFYDYPSI